MNTGANQRSATIYQFPVGGRAAAGVRRNAEVRAATDLVLPGVSEVACGSSWYHEAAIEESKPVHEH